MPCQASVGGSSTSSSATALEVYDHQNEKPGDDGNTGQEQNSDDEFEDGMDRLLHCSGLEGWDTDMDEEEDEGNEEENPQTAAETKTANPDNLETLEIEAMDVMAIESQWRLCGEQGGKDQESEHQDEKKSEEDSKDLLTTHKICIYIYTLIK